MTETLTIIPDLVAETPWRPSAEPGTMLYHWQRFDHWCRNNGVAIGVGFLMVGLVLIFFFERIFVTVQPGEVGVLWQRLFGGTVTEQIYGEGLHVIMPFNRMYTYDTRLQEVTNTYDAISADGLVMQVELSIRFRLVERNVGYLHKFVGPNYIEKLIIPELAAHMRTVISNYTPEDLYSRKRPQIQKEIFDLVSQNLETLYDPDQPSRRFAIVEAVLIRGVSIPPRVKNAIESKIEQFHKMLEYDYRIQREAKEAIRKHIEADGIRKFQQVVNESITPNFLVWKGTEATLALARSKNAKVVVIGSGKNGLPVILNAESPGGDKAAETDDEDDDTPGSAAPDAEKDKYKARPEDLDQIDKKAAPTASAPAPDKAASGLSKATEELVNQLSQNPVEEKATTAR